MRARSRVLTLAGVYLLVVVVSGPVPGAARQRDDTPTMTNSTVEARPDPLPADWPTEAVDAQLRGAACQTAYGRDAARQDGEAGDDVLPVVGTMTANAGSAMLAVRHVPFLTRRDVVRATLVADEEDPSAYSVTLELNEAGQVKAKEYTAANVGKCIAVVAGGRVVLTTSLEGPVEGETFVLGGKFDGTRGIALVNLFGR